MEIFWDQLTEKQWQGRICGYCGSSLRQDWNFGAVMAQMGASVGRAVIIEGGQEVALAQVLQRRGLRVIGQGPLWLAPLGPAAKRRVVRLLARHAGATIVTPNEALSGLGLVPMITPRSSALWRINQPESALRQGLHGKWRNRLVRAEDTARPVRLNKKMIGVLIEKESAQRRARGYQNLPGAMALSWPGQVVAYGWHSNGVLQAGMVFLMHGRTASYFLGWASAAARAGFAHGPMLWQAALTLRDRGIELLDLGEVNSEAGAGLARFKLGTGARVVAAGATSLVLPFP